ncbi:hypothetical protein [Psychroserpens sp.]|uniref:hypothetical protein n=1 Tax=Psychroserpens sp. TaxID=2020870 RepID=UPI003858F054
MKSNMNISKEINATLESGSRIQDVHVSPFFKDKTLQLMFSEKEEKQSIWSWFTPQLQLATLMVFIVLNAFAFMKLDTNSATNDIDEFAQNYSLAVNEYETLFN